MKISRIVVTGANGHLGRNLIKSLNELSIPHAAIIRANRKDISFESHTEIYRADLLDYQSLKKVIIPGDIIIHSAANFNHWANNPEKEIYQANLQMTENIVKIAKENSAAGFVFISSLGAANRQSIMINEREWNETTTNTYFRSKRDSEKLAWQLTKTYQIPMISILPAAMIGEEAHSLTPTMKVLSLILKNKIIFDLDISLNLIDTATVSKNTIQAISNNLWGERFLLASKRPIYLKDLVLIAQRKFPELKIRKPIKLPKMLTRKIISLNERVFNMLNKEPDLQVDLLDEFSVKEFCDISKAQRELSFIPDNTEETIYKSYKWIRSMT